MKYRNPVTVFSAFVITVSILSCNNRPITDLSKESIIPKPVSVIPGGKSFELKEGIDIYYQAESDDLNQIGQFLADRLKPPTGFGIEVKPANKLPGSKAIFLSLNENDSLPGDEGYRLTVTKNQILLTARKPEGVFRGVQTILQLLPPGIELSEKQAGPWTIATGIITDYPLYDYRGAMLDVSRHFFGSDDVKRFIDFLALYKMNVLHLHLSDDQGWRIEIKSWPKLTEYGGSTQVGGGKGGYYTQTQYTDIVEYARKRYITVIPEIDMPGHTNAALASYAELNCNGKATKLYTGTKVGFSSLCTDKEITYKFIDDVIRELTAITPGPYFHIGGDESHSTKTEDYIPFINKVQEIVLAYGKQPIGWDDIAIASLKTNTITQHWANIKNAEMAVSKGAKVLMSPAKKAYLDMQYDSTTIPGLHWAAYIEVDSAYMWDPASIVPGVGKDKIAGIEAPLWSETVTNMDEIEYMTFPRLPGYAEIGWTSQSARSWDEYKYRLGKHGERFKAMGINFYPSKLIPWGEVPNDFNQY